MFQVGQRVRVVPLKMFGRVVSVTEYDYLVGSEFVYEVLLDKMVDGWKRVLIYGKWLVGADKAFKAAHSGYWPVSNKRRLIGRFAGPGLVHYGLDTLRKSSVDVIKVDDETYRCLQQIRREVMPDMRWQPLHPDFQRSQIGEPQATTRRFNPTARLFQLNKEAGSEAVIRHFTFKNMPSSVEIESMRCAREKDCRPTIVGPTINMDISDIEARLLAVLHSKGETPKQRRRRTKKAVIAKIVGFLQHPDPQATVEQTAHMIYEAIRGQ